MAAVLFGRISFILFACMPIFPLIPPAVSVQMPALDSLAVSHDVAALKALASPALLKSRPNAFDFLQTGGSYGVGKYGWHVYELHEVATNKVDAVFSTPLTCEDIGEQVFRWDGQRLTAYVSEAETFGIRLVNHTITARFKPNQKWAGFVDKVQFEQKGVDTSFQFRLANHYKVTSITDDAGHPVPFASAGGVVSLAAPAIKGPFQYTVSYDGVVDLPQYAGSIASDEILLAQDYWYPLLGREPASYTLTSYTPKDWKVIGQGVLQSQKSVGDEVESVFKMDLPVVYFSFSSAKFNVATDEIGKWRFSTYAFGVAQQRLHEENLLQSDVVAFYDKYYSPFPFPTWATVATPRYGGGALEAYSYATYGGLPDEDAHEPSHTWWGGILPNSYLKSQWNESFAVFSESFFQRERELGNREERRKAFVEDAYPDAAFEASPISEGPPELGPAAGALGYGKGSMVLQMLESEMGTEMFLKCLHAWLATGGNGQLAEWSDFEAAVNRTTGKSYDWFFNEWMNRKGWPDFQINKPTYRNGQVTANVLFHGQPYRITIEVLLEFPGGSLETKRVVIGGSGELSIPVSRKPTLVSFDPWRRLLRAYHPDEAPYSLSNIVHSGHRFVDPAHPDWLSILSGSAAVTTLPTNLDGLVIVGAPQSLPQLKPLFDQVGFSVSGNKLTYDGTTIDLDHGGAFAVADLPGGGHCCLALGKILFPPNVGRSRICLVDEYGRFLRGYTPPKTSGWMTARL